MGRDLKITELRINLYIHCQWVFVLAIVNLLTSFTSLQNMAGKTLAYSGINLITMVISVYSKRNDRV